MSDTTFWWLLTGCSIALELLSGTFFLLMLSIGMAAGAISAYAGAATPIQLTVAAVVGGAAVLLWYRWRNTHLTPPDAANPDLHLDVGEIVQVEHWAADGSASVKYRGAHWAAMHRPGVVPAPGAHRIAEMIGNRLLLDKV
jgi:membrane protein implicated in regulation of membrane protease activity